MIKSSTKVIIYSSIITASLLGVNTAKADDYFDPAFVTDPSGKKTNVDLSLFERASFLPGVYRVDVYLNEKYVNTQDVLLLEDKNSNRLQPCMSDTQVAEYGIKPEYYSLLDKSGECVNFRDIQGAKAEFFGGKNQLHLTLPQIMFDSKILESREEILWDDGIPAIFTDYSFSASHQNNTKYNNKDDTYYLNLRSGINIGPWRYRNVSAWNKSQEEGNAWESQSNYIERPIRAIKSNILAGDSFSGSDVFDNVSFRGVKLWSDDQMKPNYASVYSPVISGIASIDSAIEVYQNGYIIYRTTIPAGPYELTDVIPLSNGSNLTVIEKGIDGSERRYIVPFSTLDFLQRKGEFNYSVIAGEYRMNAISQDSEGDKTKFVQSDAFYGLTNNTTLFGGIQSASRYQAYDIGIGINIPVIGAIASDIMFTHATPDNFDVMNGRAFRIRYSKSLDSTGTNINFAGYRYMSGDYISMTDMFDNYIGTANTSASLMRKGQLDLSLSQYLPESWGTLTAAVSYQSYNTYYGNEEKNTESYNIGYSNYFDDFSLNVNYSYYKNIIEKKKNNYNDFDGNDRSNDHVISLNISIPLGGQFRDNWVHYGSSYNKKGDFDNYVGIGGTALENNKLSWNVQQGYGNHDRGYYGSTYGKYKGKYGDANAGYAYKKDSRQLSYGLNGSLIMTQYDVSLSRPLGDTNGLVYTPGAENVRIINSSESLTNSAGIAIVPNLVPYRNNLIRLDTLTYPEGAEIEMALKEVYPTRGAMVLIDYKTHLGTKILVTLYDKDGNRIPFGSYAEAGSNSERFYVSNFGRLYLTGVTDTGDILVTTGSDDSNQCRFTYQTEGKRKVNGLYIFDAVCQ